MDKVDKNIIDINNLSNESDELLLEELTLFSFRSIKKPLIKELYKRTSKTTTLKEDNLELILATTKWKYFIYEGAEPSGGKWMPYPVKLPDILQELFYDHLPLVRLYNYKARIIDLEKRLKEAKLNINKSPNAHLECMSVEKQLEELKGGNDEQI